MNNSSLTIERDVVEWRHDTKRPHLIYEITRPETAAIPLGSVGVTVEGLSFCTEASVTISKMDRFEVFKRDGFRCSYCGNHPPEEVEDGE